MQFATFNKLELQRCRVIWRCRQSHECADETPPTYNTNIRHDVWNVLRSASL